MVHGVKVLVFSLFATVATYSPFFSLMMLDKGFVALDTGLLLSVSRAMMLVSTPMLCAYADRRAQHREVLAVLSLTAAASMIVLFFCPMGDFGVAASALIAYSLCSGPKMAMCDTIVVQTSGGQSYPHQRLWGSIAWGVVALSVGAILRRITWVTQVYQYVPLLHCATLLCFVAVLLRVVPPATAHVDQGEKEHADVSLPRSKWPSVAELRQYLTGYVRFVIGSSFLGPIVFGTSLLSLVEVALNFSLFPYVRRVFQAPPELLSVILAIHAISEVAVFSFGPALIRNIGVSGMLVMSACTFALKTFVYSSMTDTMTLLLVETLHGLCFAAMWTAAVTHVTSLVKKPEVPLTNSESVVVSGDLAQAQVHTTHPTHPHPTHPQGQMAPTASVAMTSLWFFSQGLPPILGGITSGSVIHIADDREVTLFKVVCVLSIVTALLFVMYARCGLVHGAGYS